MEVISNEMSVNLDAAPDSPGAVEDGILITLLYSSFSLMATGLYYVVILGLFVKIVGVLIGAVTEGFKQYRTNLHQYGLLGKLATILFVTAILIIVFLVGVFYIIGFLVGIFLEVGRMVGHLLNIPWLIHLPEKTLRELNAPAQTLRQQSMAEAVILGQEDRFRADFLQWFQTELQSNPGVFEPHIDLGFREAFRQARQF